MPRYVVVQYHSFTSKHEAERLAREAGGTLLTVAKYDERCPKGADHTHASYDGATFCASCGRYLTVRIEATR